MPSTKDAIREAFAACDADGSGGIDMSEFPKVLEMLGMAAEMAEPMMAVADTDGDSKVSFEEFFALLVKFGAAVDEPVAEEGLALEVAEAPTSTSTSEEFVIPEAPPLEGDDSLTATAPASSPEDAPLDGTAVGDPFCQAEPPPTVFCQAEPPPTVEGDGGMVAAPVPLPDFSMPTVGPLADWRMAHDDMLAERAQREAAAIGEKQAQARVALEQFYADRKARSAAKAKSNQEEASAFTADQDATMQAESWQSVCRMVDLSVKEGEKESPKKVDRMRGLLFKLKAAPMVAVA